MPLFQAITVRAWRLLLVLAVLSSAVTCVGGALFSAPAQAQGAAIRDIRVAGNRRVEPETVRSYLQFNVGDAYDAGKVDGSIKALFATGLFSDVRIDREGAGVVITVVENPVINQVAFEGNSEVDKETLRNEVQLKPRSVFTRAACPGRRAAHPRRLPPPGPVAATVEPKIIELEQNRVNLVFEINEGGATKVKGITLHRQLRLLRLPAARHHLDHRSRAGSTSSRAPASTIPTACRSIASCCASTT